MTSDALEVVLVPRVLRRFAREAPGIDLVLVPPPVRTDGVRAALEGDEVDVACGVAVEDAAGIHGVTFGTDGYLCLVRKDHPLAKGALTVERYASYGHVLIAPRGGRTGVVDTALAERGLARRIHVRTTHFSSAPSLLVDSDLVLTLSARAARRFAKLWGLAVLEPPLPLPQVTLGVRWHERHARDAGHRYLRRALAEEGRALP